YGCLEITGHVLASSNSTTRVGRLVLDKGARVRSAARRSITRRLRGVSRWGGPPYGIGVPQYGLSEPVAREPPAMSITMIGLDTAKSVFHVHAVDEAGKLEMKRKL